MTIEEQDEQLNHQGAAADDVYMSQVSQTVSENDEDGQPAEYIVAE